MQNSADYNMFPADALLFELTGDSEYRDRAVESLVWFASAELNGSLADDQNHCFEPLNSYAILRRLGVDPFERNATMGASGRFAGAGALAEAPTPNSTELLRGLRSAMRRQCYDLKPDHRGTEAIHNHGAHSPPSLRSW